MAARKIPAHRGGGHLHPATLTRWILHGARSATGQRAYLEAVRCGGRWLTSEGALTRFIEALTDHAQGVRDGADVRPPAARLRASEAAARELEKFGI